MSMIEDQHRDLFFYVMVDQLAENVPNNRSTLEAEYIATSKAAKEAFWFKKFVA